jgi:methylthioribose-1-phosphate isomerase
MKAIEWLGDRVRIIDQTRLPDEESYVELTSYQAVAGAISDMLVRGAPAIGVAAAYGVALGAGEIKTADKSRFLKELSSVIQTIAATRPTARNLFAVVERMRRIAEAGDDVTSIKKTLIGEAVKIHAEEEVATESISRLGAELIKDGSGVLTHCNTGPLATAGYGTALGVIICAHRQGKRLTVFVTETRPRLQGARLTAWELGQAGVPFTLITDSMAGCVMQRGEVGCVIVGADRIAGNGDTANKIGTYSLAVLAKEHDIPFYVAAPTSTIDPAIASGDEILIEERDAEEVTHIGGVRIAPEGVNVINPAFDVTPHRYITAIITARGIIRQPFGEGIGNII